MGALKLPDFANTLINEPFRYKVLHGGRGSSKSYSIADSLLIRGAQEPRRILCAREFQNSISESVLQLLTERIEALGLADFYSSTQKSITGVNGTEFFFKGVRMNPQSVKSMQGITDCWIEEAQTISQFSLDILIPTVRVPGSEFFFSFNPENEDDPVYTKFVKDLPPPSTFVKQVNWQQNPWFPDVLRMEMEHLYKVNPELAAHVWGGACRTQSDAQIFKGKFKVQEFDIPDDADGPYQGSDWGFSVDPTTAVRIYLDYRNMRILVRYAAGQIGVDTDDIPAKIYSKIPNFKDYKIWADNARPETISHMAKKGYDIEGAEKWKGSVEDGIEFMKNFEVWIHPGGCYLEDDTTNKTVGVHTEFKNYSYKVDRLTSEVTTQIVDKYNHYIDAIRYAIWKIITNGFSVLDAL